MDLSFSLPGSDVTIGAKGRVVWTYDMKKDSIRLVPGSGIRFVEMSAEERQLLEECLTKLAPTPSAREAPRVEAP